MHWRTIPAFFSAAVLVGPSLVTSPAQASTRSHHHHYARHHLGLNGETASESSGRTHRLGRPFSGSSGIASVYSGGRTASGERMSSGAVPAAHRTLPFGTSVTVINNRTGRAVVVRINDRGPFVRGRVIDLSPAAARAIGVQ